MPARWSWCSVCGAGSQETEAYGQGGNGGSGGNGAGIHYLGSSDYTHSDNSYGLISFGTGGLAGLGGGEIGVNGQTGNELESQ